MYSTNLKHNERLHIPYRALRGIHSLNILVPDPACPRKFLSEVGMAISICVRFNTNGKILLN